jgi:translation initiation factor 2 subunit 2
LFCSSPPHSPVQQESGDDDSSAPAAAPAPAPAAAAAPAAPADGAADADVDDLLAGKKKKKKKKADDGAAAPSEAAPAETTASPAAPAEEGDDFKLTLKKKKKKTASSKSADAGPAADLEDDEETAAAVAAAAAAAAAAANDDDDDDGGDVEESTYPDGNDDDDDGDIDFNEVASQVANMSIGAMPMPWLNSDRDYLYKELLERAFNLIQQKNPALMGSDRRKFVLKPPQLSRVGTKKCAFINFADECRLMNRPPDHVLLFILTELGTSGSIDGNNQLIIRGRFQAKQMENVLRRYVREYVMCQMCKSANTVLTKENRLNFLCCQTCGARRSVAAIKSGFQAITGKRAQMRT